MTIFEPTERLLEAPIYQYWQRTDHLYLRRLDHPLFDPAATLHIPVNLVHHSLAFNIFLNDDLHYSIDPLSLGCKTSIPQATNR